MSKWLVITISAVLVTVGLVTWALIFFIERYQKEADAADDMFLRSKVQMLNNVVDAQLQSGILYSESNNIASRAAASTRAVTQEGAKIAADLAKRKKYVDLVRTRYHEELAKIK
jgi:hypothetical protein